MKKRFIAGAVCPSCRVVDRIVMLTTTADEWIECVACGHRESRPTEVAQTATQSTEPDQIGVVQFKPLP
ncbi:MAG: YheV family putative zinc ribbon protein [Pseudomonadota bacterium]|nr:YheV family putative zinc ribbon protein [Pseudomonadota bacterium]